MARVRKSTLSFDAITLEGSLLSSAKFAAVAERKAEEQTDADYSIPKGLTLRDETARYFRIGQALFRDLHASNTPARHKTIEFTEQLLRIVFGFSEIQAVKTPKFRDDRIFPVTLEALGGRVPVVVVPPSDGLDHAAIHFSQDRRRSAASALQDWLNADEAALWGLCTNGESLRLLRDNESLTRPAYLEADLRQIFEAEDYAGFSALWLVLHASRFGRAGALPSDCPLERWRESGSKEGLAARDRLRDGVEAALLALGTGFLTNPANTELSARLREGTWPIDEYFRQLLRLVYRLIFLLAAEDRNLLHIPKASDEQRQLYALGYSLGALRDRAIRRSGWDNFRDRWSGLRVTFFALANGEPRLALPALGGLFATTATPELDRAEISNRFLMEAIFRLAWLRDDGLLMPVNWRDMETEELGSVYESLLELTPRLSSDGREFKFAEGEQSKGNVRKTTGSYYTPDSLVQVLLDSALDPILDRTESESEDPVRGLLSVTVIDPACGSGHFLLAAARRIARRVVRLRHGDIHTEQQRLSALRDVVRSCIHGVDRNPMAVELTKVALWIETVEPGKPLGFLDASIRLGDSLLGIFSMDALNKGVPEAAYKPLTGDDTIIAKDFGKKNKDEIKGQTRMRLSGAPEAPALSKLAQSLHDIRQLPEDTVDEIEAKRQRFESTSHDPRLQNLAQAADLYIAAYLTPKTTDTARDGGNSLIPTTADVRAAISAGTVYGPRLGAARQLALTARAFHWPLEFPDVVNAGGFDVVLGNPPWERIKLQEQEFFASLDASIATASTAAERSRMIRQLRDSAAGTHERKLYERFESAKRLADAGSAFARTTGASGGRFPFTGKGDVNTYALFAELFEALAKRSGRSGMVVPTGLVTSDTTKAFFEKIIVERRLISFYSFFEIRLIFLATDDRNPFGLFTTGRSSLDPEFAFFLKDVGEITEHRRRFRLTPEQILRINPNTKTAPVFRSQKDAEISAGIYSRVSVMMEDIGTGSANPWLVDLSAMFHMSNDSDLFKSLEELEADGYRQSPLDRTRLARLSDDGQPESGASFVPLYEAKMIHLLNHRWATYDAINDHFRDSSLEEKRNTAFETNPKHWISEGEVAKKIADLKWDCDWLFSFRNFGRATDERSLISSVVPAFGIGNSLPLILPSPRLPIVGFIANMCALVFDYSVRQKLSGANINFYIIKQLPVLPPDAYSEEALDFIRARVLELTYTSYSVRPFAQDLGYEGEPLLGTKTGAPNSARSWMPGMRGRMG